jgi:hypothetical protein
LASLFVSQNGIINGTVEKLVQQALQFHLAVHGHDVVGERFVPEKLPEMIARERQRPHELMQADSLCRTRRRNLLEAGRYINFGFL